MKTCYINYRKVKIMAKLCTCRICGIDILDEDICDICKKTNNKEKTIVKKELIKILKYC